MNETVYANITNIMKTLCEMPTNVDFMYPVADRLEGYREKIAHPMDLGTINEKLNQKEYKKAVDWYNDVLLVYNNSLEYYPPEHFYSKLAEYNLKAFKKLAIGLDCQDIQSWYSLLRKTFDQLTELAGQSPVPQGIDPWLSNLPFHAEIAMEEPPLHPTEISETVDFLNRELQQSNDTKASNVRKDIYAILKEMEPEMKFTPDENMIDAKNLKEITIKALNIYMKAHSRSNF